ncbi:MAG: HNH endonuclease [Proteobacteria bacterium]|nr:HNH endonuclease [Pseudomonadota bacterium]TRZ90211.1 MAG: HNH endonuclease [Rhodocyclaceae bacterium]
MQVLGLDIAGSPFRWLTAERAAYHVATGKVAWSLGEPAAVFHGGVNRSGEQSILEIPAVIALAKSEAMVRHTQDALPLGHDNDLLFRRDRSVCAYCGDVFERSRLTRDHVFPRARGGKDVWANVVTACRSCNMVKGCRVPEEAHMPLLYVPYEPCRFEHFILSGRRILADQADYLSRRLPAHSRATPS